MDTEYRYRSRWVVPVSAPPLPGGIVTVRAGRIVSVEPAGSASSGRGPIEDLGETILLPAAVNAHTHLDWSHRRGVARSGTGAFTDWVYDLITAPLPPPERIESAALAEAERIADEGTALIGDFCLSPADALRRMRRARLGGIVFAELLHLQACRAAEMIRSAEALSSALPPAATPREGRREGGSPPLAIAPAPHGPHTVSRELLEALAGGLARGGRCAIHLAESAAEREFLLTGQGPFRRLHERRGNWDGSWTPPGVSPVAYLDRLGLLTDRTLAVHCVHVDEDDIARLARHGTFVAICPRSNAWTGAGRAPLPSLLRAGVRCCLGTDSLASNDDLDPAAELAFARTAWPEVSPVTLVRLATLGGAEALGCAGPGGFGSLAPGQAAALASAAIPPAAPEGAEPHAILCGDFGRVAFRRLRTDTH